MFLKRRRVNKRILFNKFFIDPWLQITLKKKFKNKTTQRYLQFFGRYVAKRLLGRFLNTFWRSRKKRRFRRFYKKTFQARRKSVFSKPKKNHWEVRPRHIAKASPLKKIILVNLKGYLRAKAVLGTQERLINLWRQRFKKKGIKKLLRRYTKRKPYVRKYYRLRRRNEYIVSQLMDLVFQQYHYGFSTLSSFKAYIKKYTSSGFFQKFGAFGVDGMLANQLCRIGISPNIRSSYILVRTGGVLVNSFTEKNPRRMLIVGDEFRLIRPFSLLMFRFYSKRLRRRHVIFNVPRYYEYNFKLMVFRIWRRPTKHERKVIPYYPFLKNELSWGAIKYFKWEN